MVVGSGQGVTKLDTGQHRCRPLGNQGVVSLFAQPPLLASQS